MHVFWERGELTAAEIRESLAGQGRELAYTTVRDVDSDFV